MSKKKINYQKNTAEELEKLVKTKKEHLRQLRFDLIADKLKNYRGVRKERRNIARMLTELSMKRTRDINVKIEKL